MLNANMISGLLQRAGLDGLTDPAERMRVALRVAGESLANAGGPIPDAMAPPAAPVRQPGEDESRVPVGSGTGRLAGPVGGVPRKGSPQAGLATAPRTRPQPLTSASEPPPVSRGQVLLEVLGGQETWGKARKRLEAERAAEYRQAQINELADQMNMSPEQRMFFLADPEGFFNAMETHYSARDVAGGNTVKYGKGGAEWTAPRTGMDAGVPYIQGGDGKANYFNARPLGPDERADNQLGLDRLAEDARHNKASEALGYGNLGVAQGGLAVDRDRAALARQQYESPNITGPGNVAGRIYDKLARGEALTPGEQQAFDAYNTARMDPMMAGVLNYEPDEPAPPPPLAPRTRARNTAPPPAPSATSKAPRRGKVRKRPDGVYEPQTAADMKAIPSGAIFVNPGDKRLIRKK